MLKAKLSVRNQMMKNIKMSCCKQYETKSIFLYTEVGIVSTGSFKPYTKYPNMDFIMTLEDRAETSTKVHVRGKGRLQQIAGTRFLPIT